MARQFKVGEYYQYDTYTAYSIIRITSVQHHVSDIQYVTFQILKEGKFIDNFMYHWFFSDSELAKCFKKLPALKSKLLYDN